MKRNWTEEELVGRGTLFPDELAPVGAKTGHTRPGFAAMLRSFAEDHFPCDKHGVPVEVLLRFVGEQVGESAEGWLRYDRGGRAIKYHRAEIRRFFGFREATAKKAGLRNAADVSPHWLRHAHASHAMDWGAKIHLVQATLGHSDLSTTGRGTSTLAPTNPRRSPLSEDGELTFTVGGTSRSSCQSLGTPQSAAPPFSHAFVSCVAPRPTPARPRRCF